jgi:2-haloacid dehalogenase
LTIDTVAAVVFDLGGVLIDWNPRHLYRKLFDDESAMEDFLSNVCTLEWHVEHDRGRSTAESCRELALAHPEHAGLILAWAERTEEMVAGAIDGSVEVLADLRAAGMPCYILSNMEPETFPRRLERFGFLSWFEGQVISGYEGVVKPDPRIFEVLLERFDLTAGRTLFVDDSAVNVAAAAAVGLSPIRFESPASLRRALEAAGALR